jgi:1-acyl-sn-glycerol-3-phosphate acyltransferase
MIGTREAQPIGRIMPHPFRTITIRISPPMHFDRYATRAEDPKVLRQITDEIMFELRELSGQEYVDRYAARKTEGSAEPVVVRTRPDEGMGAPTELAVAG